MRSIISISSYVKRLAAKDRDIFYTIYTLTDDSGKLKIPKAMEPWVKKNFGSKKIVENQRIIRVDNNLTFESALFNEIRARRPIDAKNTDNTEKVINAKEGDPFCHPKKLTPKDVFGREKGKSCITSANIAKYDALHGLVVFGRHNPLKITDAELKDYLKTAQKWIEKAHRTDPKRKYPYIMWNCLWRAASSIIHGHMQVLLAKTMHYGDIEKLRIVSEEYYNEFGYEYLDDVFHVHEKLGLGFEKNKIRIFASITPKKDKDLWIIADSMTKLSGPLYKTISAYLKMGVESFNVGIYQKPLDNSWNIPVVARIIDRGKLSSNSSDIGGMELLAGTNIIETDPYRVIEKVRKEF